MSQTYFDEKEVILSIKDYNYLSDADIRSISPTALIKTFSMDVGFR